METFDFGDHIGVSIELTCGRRFAGRYARCVSPEKAADLQRERGEKWCAANCKEGRCVCFREAKSGA